MAQEGRKVKPILPTTPSRSTERKTSRTNLTGLKPAEDFFFLSSFPPEFLLPFCPSSYHPLPFFIHSSCLLLFIVLFKFLLKNSFLSCLRSFFIPSSFLPFLFYSFFPSFRFLFSPLSLFPTGETIKPGVLKRPELDRVTTINVSSRPVSTGD